MKTAILLLAFLCIAAVNSIYHDKQTVCYFRNWSQHGRKQAKFLPEDVDARYCNILKYAFVYVNEDTFEIQTLQPNDAEMLAKFVALKKHNPYFKIIIAIGKSDSYLISLPVVSASLLSHILIQKYVNLSKRMGKE